MKIKDSKIYNYLSVLTLAKVKQFLYSLYRWARSGFKISKLADERQAICNECPHFRDNTCKLCGCHTPVKTKWFTEECPIEKW